jgi:hypothetical protein
MLFLGIVCTGCMMIAMASQRLTLYRQFEEANHKMLLDVRAEVDRLRIQNEQSIANLHLIQKSVETATKTINQVKKDISEE